MSTELKLSPLVAQWMVQAFMRTLAVYCVVQGLVITFGDLTRWNSPIFSVALLVPGSPPTWGIILVVAGALGLVGSYVGKLKLIAAGMFIASAWSLFFAMSLLLTAVTHSDVSFAAPFSYTVLAVLFSLLGVAYRESH